MELILQQLSLSPQADMDREEYRDNLYNGKLGNMNVSDAVKLTKIINPKVGIPTHYGMFASNTEKPVNYTSKLDCGFIMEYNKEYDVEEVLKNV